MPKARRKTSNQRARIPLRERVKIESLHDYLRAESRAAGKGKTLAARERFARRCGTSTQYLTQLALGIRRAQPDIAIRIEQASYGIVRAEHLCPNFDWAYAKVRRVVQVPEPDATVPRPGNIEITSPVPEQAAA